MIELLGVHKRYGDHVALHPLDLVIEAGRTTVLIGPSGCGKSTTLRLVNGLVDPTGGEVRFEGDRVTRANVNKLRHRMGYVIQEGGLFPHLTARQNVTLLAEHLCKVEGHDAAAIGPRVAELARLVTLDEAMLDRYPLELSGGQRQRVGLMRALMLDPALLLLDEPLGALDPMIRADLQRDLRAIIRSLGKAVLMVTHDMREAAYFADTIVLMREGRVVQRGTLAELIDTPADPFVHAFINAQRSPIDADLLVATDGGDA